MNFSGSKNTNRLMGKNKADSIETEKPISIGGAITSFGKDTAQQVQEGFTDVGKGIFEQLLNSYKQETDEKKDQYEKLKEEHQEPQEGQEKPHIKLDGGTIFDSRLIEERRQMQEIHQTIETIGKQLSQLEKANKQMMSTLKEVESDVLNTPQEKQGIYHLFRLQRLSEMIAKLLMNVSDSMVWLDAFRSKKAKRGSAFAARSKKAGTSYSLSQELSNARSIQ